MEKSLLRYRSVLTLGGLEKDSLQSSDKTVFSSKNTKCAWRKEQVPPTSVTEVLPEFLKGNNAIGDENKKTSQTVTGPRP